MKNKNKNKNKNNKIAFFAGISAFIGVFESLFIPFPLFRLGISNIPVCLSFNYFNFFECLFIVLFKVIFSHLFRGTLFSYPFIIGFSGNILFFIISYPVFKIIKNHTSFISISVIGSIMHNIGQILAAYIVISSLKALYLIGIILILIGIILGFINGIICNIIYNKIFTRINYDRTI